MPIYEYCCGACGHELETLQKLSDPPLSSCPACGGETLQKLVSAAGFRLKGSGWYETDFKSGNKKNLAAGDGAKPSSEKSSGEKPSGDKASSSSEGVKSDTTKPKADAGSTTTSNAVKKG